MRVAIDDEYWHLYCHAFCTSLRCAARCCRRLPLCHACYVPDRCKCPPVPFHAPSSKADKACQIDNVSDTVQLVRTVPHLGMPGSGTVSGDETVQGRYESPSTSSKALC